MKSLFWKKFEIKKLQTSVRIEEGTSLTYLIDRNKYIYIGGIKPKEVQKTAANPEKQQSQSPGISFSLPKTNAISFSTSNVTQSNLMDIVYILDPIEYQWSEQKCTGRCPVRRVNHSTWYEAPYLFMYGGRSADNKNLNDMYVLNVDNYQWKRFFYLEGPPTRQDFQIVSMANNKYLIAGASIPENWFYNDIWQFSFENVVWSSNSLELPGISWTRIEEVEDNPVFRPMKAHSASKVSDTQIFIFGGFNDKRQCTDTSLLFDVEQRKIVEFETKGMKPSARAYAKIIPVKENLVCLFGGISCSEDQIKTVNANLLNDYYLLNLNEGYWMRPQCGGYIPPARYNFSFACNQSEAASEIILLGGNSAEQVDKFLYVLTEMNGGDTEGWGESENQQRLEFEGYREAIKAKKSQEELQNVSMMTLEFSQAENFIVDQKRSISEQESTLKKIKQDNEDMKYRLDEYEQKIHNLQKELDNKNQGLIDQIQMKKEQNEERLTFLLRVKALVCFERKKRKFIQLKQFQLQDALRKAESFIITVDSLYSKLQREDLLEGVISKEAINKIEKLKIEHKNTLHQFRDNFDGSMQKEKKIKVQIKEKKSQLLPEYSVSKEWKAFLSKEEVVLFDAKNKL